MPFLHARTAVAVKENIFAFLRGPRKTVQDAVAFCLPLMTSRQIVVDQISMLDFPDDAKYHHHPYISIYFSQCHEQQRQAWKLKACGVQKCKQEAAMHLPQEGGGATHRKPKPKSGFLSAFDRFVSGGQP